MRQTIPTSKDMSAANEISQYTGLRCSCSIAASLPVPSDSDDCRRPGSKKSTMEAECAAVGWFTSGWELIGLSGPEIIVVLTLLVGVQCFDKRIANAGRFSWSLPAILLLDRLRRKFH